MEEASSRTLGDTLKVPSVRELVKQELAAVPPRYIRDDTENTSSSILMPQVPVIDMEKLLEIGDDNSELERLHFACNEWGFFQCFSIHQWKRREEQQEGDVEGFGQAFVFLEEQKLDWGDLFYMTTLPTNLRKPHLFPKLPLSLRDIMEAHCKELKSLAISILCQLAKALRMDENEMRDLFSDGMQLIRMNYYPPCPEPQKTIGISLQVRKDGIWVPVKPLSNAFIVNVGDMMGIVNNGVYRSIEHRAVVNSDKERLSLATFYIFNLDSELGPAHSLIGPNNPPNFRRVRVGKYLQDFFARQLDGKSFIDRMKVETKDDEP
ncbi:hypothetical protein K7X08_033105 [Anisodus acutangulus]|uniref:Fe2OG dioxygenase domain-containing protein n=1 Tax=Anisodus acutangulus TaxID=402998 RepID=A0A9Q1M4B5_9SOLA|nr:hypothetical protein K7X08_033105 [Anisodus acutangulus]